MKGTNYLRFMAITCALMLFFVTMPRVAIAESYDFKIGDKVRLIGKYTASSDGTGTKYKGLYDYYIIGKIAKGKPNPYALKPIGKDWIDGWASYTDILPDYTQVIGTDFLCAIQVDLYGAIDDPLDAVYRYYQLFNHNSKYDVKREGVWNNLFSVPFPGVNGKFVFMDYIITPEDLGNYLYGLAGSYLGFSAKLIHQGAGFAKQGNFDYVNRPDLYYGDDENDYFWVEMGITNQEGRYGSDFDLERFPSWLLNGISEFAF